MSREEAAQLSKDEFDWLSIIRLNKLIGIKGIEKRWRFGRFRLRFEWRSSKNLWGRFGGGWNWKLGFQIGSSTIIFNLLVASFSITLEKQKGEA
jgi:hypothetical protein